MPSPDRLLHATNLDLEVTEPALLIRISKLFRPEMTPEQMYEATRGVWVLGKDRDAAKFALCVARGVVHEVYAIGTWHPAGSTNYATRSLDQVSIPGRWEFTGVVAPPAIRNKHFGKAIAHYFQMGNSNPINYVNIKRA